MTEEKTAKYYSEWMEIDQDLVSGFGMLTRDEQFIHMDPEAARQTPLGGTIAHGFLSLSLLSYLGATTLPPFEHPDFRLVMSMNYGFDKIRFLAPVPVGKKIRAVFEDKGWRQKTENSVVVTRGVTIEIEGGATALVADWLFLLSLAPKG